MKNLANLGIVVLVEGGKTSKVVQRKIFDLRAGIDGKVVVRQEKVVSTIAEIQTYINELEQKLSSTKDDDSLANINLQNTLQRQQQNLQMLSNILKMVHDTALAMIRKIG